MSFTSSEEIKNIDSLNAVLASNHEGRIFDAMNKLLANVTDDLASPTWTGRSLRLLSVVLMALTHLRDRGDILLDIDVLQESFSMKQLVQLAYFSNLPSDIANKIIGFLEDLPGYQAEDAMKGQFNIETERTLGYVSMLLLTDGKRQEREGLADCIP